MLLFVTACSGPNETTRGGTVDPAPNDREPIQMAQYEDFDMAPYRDEPTPEAGIKHDVPASLLNGQTRPTTSQTAQGYRIQLFSSQEKTAADGELERAMLWWKAQLRNGNLDDVYDGQEPQPPVYLIFRQPYYRVRVGNFAARDEALRLLPLVQEQFPGAFIAFDTVTIIR